MKKMTGASAPLIVMKKATKGAEALTYFAFGCPISTLEGLWRNEEAERRILRAERGTALGSAKEGILYEVTNPVSGCLQAFSFLW